MNKEIANDATFIDRFVADYCRPHAIVEAERLSAYVVSQRLRFLSSGNDGIVLAAGAVRKSEPAEVQSPAEEVVFTFASEGGPDEQGAWKAGLTVPPNATPETMLSLVVQTRDGAVAADGLFKLSGIVLPVIGGRGEIMFGSFLAGIKDTDVSFKVSGGSEIKGTLAFFC